MFCHMLEIAHSKVILHDDFEHFWENFDFFPLDVLCVCVCFISKYMNVQFDITLGSAWGDGGCSGCPVPGRASHSADTQHLPLRWSVGQERHSRCAQAQGDHQCLKETKDTLSHHFP